MKTTKEMIAVMQAYADGKGIEYSFIKDSWYDDKNPCWNLVDYNYRVKEAPEYIPFTFEDAEFLIGKIVSSKKKQYKVMIFECNKKSVQHYTYEELLNNWTFLDGSPCGKLKQQ